MSKLPKNIRCAVCYIRKSREDEEAELRGEDTLLKQRELMLRDVLTCYTFDYDIAEEVASGDSIRDRPVFRNLLPELGTKYQAIVCKDLSRLGRGSYGDMGIVYDIIRDRRIFIITKDAVYDPRNFSDLRMIRFSLFFNREEYEMTVWRLTEGKYDGAQRGKWVAGSVPYGFTYDQKLQVLVPNQNEAKIVQSIYHWYTVDGLGYSAIATRLRRLGIKTARRSERWYPEVIRRILQNPVYKGMLVFRKTQRNKMDGRLVARPAEEHIVIDNAFEPIVDVETWSKAQDRRTKAHFKQPRVKHDFSPCELAGIVTCNACQRKMIRQFHTQRYKRQDGSISRYEKEFLYCSTCGYAVKYRNCETQLLQVVGRMSKLNSELLEYQIQLLQGKTFVDAPLDLVQVHRHLEERRRVLDNRLMRAREFLLDGTFTRVDFDAARSKYEQDLLDLTKDEENLVRKLTRSKPTGISSIRASRTEWRSLIDVYQCIEDKSAKNRLLRGLFDEVKLKLVHKGSGKRNPTRFDLFIRLHPSLLPFS